MDRPTDPPTTAPGLDLAFVRIGQSLIASGFVSGVVAVAAVVQNNNAVDGSGPGVAVTWVLWLLAVLLLVNGTVVWLVFDQRVRAALELARLSPEGSDRPSGGQ